MTRTAVAIDALRAELVDVLAFGRAAGLADDDLLVELGALEALGRVVDARRAAYAGEVADRSRVELANQRLSAKKGCRSAAELIERVTQVSGAEARRRVLVGSATRARLSLSGEPAPPLFPEVASAVASGELGADVACTIIRDLDRTRPVADTIVLATAEQALVAEALGLGDSGPVRCTADEIRVQAQAWAVFLDQDGREPDERAMRRRGFRLGRARGGLVPVSGELMPEVAAGLTRLFDAHLSPRSGFGARGGPSVNADDGREASDAHGRETSESADTEAADAASLAAAADTRTSDQQRHDVLAAIIETAARSGEHPTIGGAAPTVLVSVRAADLAERHGSAYADGVDVPISMRAAEHLACAGGLQSVVFDDAGRIIRLGSAERCFTAQQRRAISVRDGGCLIPGCTVPTAWAEIHHVVPHAEGGATHPDNGVLLCWFHHRTIDTSGWVIRMVHGVPHIKAPRWLDPGGTWRVATKSPTRLADRLERRRRGDPPGRECEDSGASAA